MRVGSSVVVLALLAGIARADGSAADEAFKNGRELLKANKFKEACDAFEKSQSLDPQLGTQFNIAQCDEKIGKLASALAIYRDLAARDPNAARKTTSAERAAALGPQVPKLVVQIANAPASTAVTLDGKPIAANTPLELDDGDYAVVVQASGFGDFTSKVHVTDTSGTSTLVVSLVPVAPAPHEVAVEQPVPAVPEPAQSHRKLYAGVAVGAGGAAIVTGVVFGVMARSKWNDATAICPSSACATQADLDRANGLRSSATSRATLATAFVIGGGVLAAAGVALWVTAPTETHGVAVVPTADGAQLTLSGRF